MLQFTTIARGSDGLVLGADTETTNATGDLEKTKATAKNLLKKLSGQGANLSEALTVESSTSSFHILNEGGVLFLTMCDPSCASQVAFSYLEAVAKEFLHQHGQQVDSAKRPYYFIKFDVTLQKLKKQFNVVQYGNVAPPRNSTPERKTFRDVMGYGDGPLQHGKRSSSSANGNTDVVIAIAAGGFALLVMIIVIIVAFSA